MEPNAISSSSSASQARLKLTAQVACAMAFSVSDNPLFGLVVTMVIAGANRSWAFNGLVCHPGPFAMDGYTLSRAPPCGAPVGVADFLVCRRRSSFRAAARRCCSRRHDHLGARSWRAVANVLRVRRMSRRDWRLTGTVLVVVALAMATMHLFNTIMGPGLAPDPPFMSVKPLAPTQYYILGLWLPFFFLNIVGEEFWWRGFIQPRQEPVFGDSTWFSRG